jgi:hypothetical protein
MNRHDAPRTPIRDSENSEFALIINTQHGADASTAAARTAGPSIGGMIGAGLVEIQRNVARAAAPGPARAHARPVSAPFLSFTFDRRGSRTLACLNIEN